MVSLVASEFPGLFTHDQFMDLEFRVLVFWANEADKKRLVREATMINAMRYAQADREDYLDRMTMLEWELQLLNNPNASEEQ